MASIDELLASFEDKSWSLEFIAKNKNNIKFVKDNELESLARFFDETYDVWDFYPGKRQIQSVYKLKVAELKKLSGCSSCMINRVKRDSLHPVQKNITNATNILQIIDSHSE